MPSRTTRIFALAVPLFAVALAATAQAAQAPRRVAVLDFSAPGVDAAKAAGLTTNLASIVANEVGKLGHGVISTADIKTMLAFDQQKTLLGCNEDASCLAEIGGALGAEYLVSGAIGLLGDAYTVSLALIDARAAKVERRFQGNAGSESVLADTARRGVQVLFGQQVELTGTATLFIKTDPSGANVELDGKHVGVSPLTVDEVPVGDHLVVATKGDLRGKAKVHLASQGIEKVMVTLVGAPPVALKVFSSPPEATVLIDGVRVGVTPVILPSVASGAHTIRIALAHHEPHERQVHFAHAEFERSGGIPFKFEATLTPSPVNLRVSGLVPGAQVLLDGQPTPPVTRCTPGRHTVVATAHGYPRYEKVVEVAVGRDTEVAFPMTMLPEYRDYLDTVAHKKALARGAAWTSVEWAAAGGLVLMWASVLHRSAVDAQQRYRETTVPEDIGRLYSKAQSLSDQARFAQAVGFGVLGASAAWLGVSFYSLLSRPDDPVGPVRVTGVVLPAEGHGASMQLAATF